MTGILLKGGNSHRLVFIRFSVFCYIPPLWSLSFPSFYSFLIDSALFPTQQILWITYCREKLSCICLCTHVFVKYVSQELVIFYIHNEPTFLNHKKEMPSPKLNSTWGRLALPFFSLQNKMK